MGQYFVIANLDKKEYINPHKMMYGARLCEIAGKKIAAVFPFLLRMSGVRAGGDVQSDSHQAGRWAGDRVAVVGDQDESGLFHFIKICPGWKEISPDILEELNKFIETPVVQVELIDY